MKRWTRSLRGSRSSSVSSQVSVTSKRGRRERNNEEVASRTESESNKISGAAPDASCNVNNHVQQLEPAVSEPQNVTPPEKIDDRRIPIPKNTPTSPTIDTENLTKNMEQLPGPESDQGGSKSDYRPTDLDKFLEALGESPRQRRSSSGRHSSIRSEIDDAKSDKAVKLERTTPGQRLSGNSDCLVIDSDTKADNQQSTPQSKAPELPAEPVTRSNAENHDSGTHSKYTCSKRTDSANSEIQVWADHHSQRQEIPSESGFETVLKSHSIANQPSELAEENQQMRYDRPEGSKIEVETRPPTYPSYRSTPRSIPSPLPVFSQTTPPYFTAHHDDALVKRLSQIGFECRTCDLQFYVDEDTEYTDHIHSTHHKTVENLERVLMVMRAEAKSKQANVRAAKEVQFGRAKLLNSANRPRLNPAGTLSPLGVHATPENELFEPLLSRMRGDNFDSRRAIGDDDSTFERHIDARSRGDTSQHGAVRDERQVGEDREVSKERGVLPILRMPLPYKCQYCTETFLTSDDMQRHWHHCHRHHSQNSTRRSSKSPSFSIENGPDTQPVFMERPIRPASSDHYNCTFCNLVFGSAERLVEHEKTIHQEQLKLRHEQTSVFKCEICLRKFSTQQGLKNHYTCIHKRERGYMFKDQQLERQRLKVLADKEIKPVAPKPDLRLELDAAGKLRDLGLNIISYTPPTTQSNPDTVVRRRERKSPSLDSTPRGQNYGLEHIEHSQRSEQYGTTSKSTTDRPVNFPGILSSLGFNASQVNHDASNKPTNIPKEQDTTTSNFKQLLSNIINVSNANTIPTTSAAISQSPSITIPEAKRSSRHIALSSFSMDNHSVLLNSTPMHLTNSTGSTIQRAQMQPNGKLAYPCDLCGKLFSTAGNLKTHTKTVHLKIRDYKCDTCSKMFLQWSHLKQHKLRYHAEDVQAILGQNDDGKTLPNTSKNRKHKCHFCHSQFSTLYSLINHVKGCSSGVRPRPDLITATQKTNASEQSSLGLEKLLAQFKNFSESTHNNNKREGSNADATSPTAKIPRMRGQGDIRKLTMSAPSAQYNTSTAPERPRLTQPSITLADPVDLAQSYLSDKDVDENPVFGPAAPAVRPESVEQAKTLGLVSLAPFKEFNQGHSSAPLVDTNSVYDCMYCDFVFDNSASLKKHIRAEHEETMNWKCEYCGLLFNQTAQLTRHRAEAHGVSKQLSDEATLPRLRLGDNKHHCELCTDSFSSLSALSTHLQEVHDKRQVYKCNECPNLYYTIEGLRRHIKSTHEKRVDYVCKICGEKFAYCSSLRRHERTVHENRRDYECNECGKKFGESGNLRSHQKIVHEKRLNYHCPIDGCSKKFGQPGRLRRHLHMAHRDELQGQDVTILTANLYARSNGLNHPSSHRSTPIESSTTGIHNNASSISSQPDVSSSCLEIVDSGDDHSQKDYSMAESMLSVGRDADSDSEIVPPNASSAECAHLLTSMLKADPEDPKMT